VGDGLFCQVVVCVCELADALDAVNPVDEGDDLLHRQIPGYVHQQVELDGGDGDVPGSHERRRRVRGKEFEADRVRFVYYSSIPPQPRHRVKRTYRDHALRVVIQVLHYLLDKRVNPGSGNLVAQEPALLLEGFEQLCQLPYDAFVGAEFILFIKEDGEIEDELVALVAAVIDADGIAKEAVFVGADGDKTVTELLFRNYVRANLIEVDEWWGVDGWWWRRCD